MKSVMKYRVVFTRRLMPWALASACVRLPVAMAALAMVFLGRGSPGGYAEGGTLAALYVLGEVAGAGLLGPLIPAERTKLCLVAGMALAAASFAVMSALPAAPIAILGPAAFLAGGAPAIAPGALRSVLLGLVAEDDAPAALSADSVLTELIWMPAPGLVVLLALQVSASAPVALCAASMAAAAMTALFLQFAPHDKAGPRPALRVLLSGWPIYLTAAAAMSISAVAELDLPPLLQARHDPVGLAGVLLVGFGALSALGSFTYGLRKWPGTPRRHSQIFLAATAAAIVVESCVPHLAAIVIGFLAAGCLQPVVMITRSLSLRAQLPENAQTAGYSLMYSIQGIGYSVSAAIAAALLRHFDASTVIVCGVAIGAVLAVVSATGEIATGAASPQHTDADAGQNAT